MQIITTVRYHLTPVRMATIHTSTNECLWGCGEKGISMPCRWEWWLVQTLWKSVCSFLNKLKTDLPYDFAIPFLGIYPNISALATCLCCLECHSIHQNVVGWIPGWGTYLGLWVWSCMVFFSDSKQGTYWRQLIDVSLSHQCFSDIDRSLPTPNPQTTKHILGTGLKKRKRNLKLERTFTPMFIAALLTIAKIWKQPKCLWVDEWVRKL